MEQEVMMTSEKLEKQKMKCLVTGGAGFIGSNLVDKLCLVFNDVLSRKN